MSDVALAAPLDRRPQRTNRTAFVTAKLKRCIDAMVWDGLSYDLAAMQNNVPRSSMRYALKQPHVLAYMREQKQMLLASDGPRRIHRYVEISKAADNMPAVAALDRLEAMDEAQRPFGSSSQAIANTGVTIVINGAGQVDLGHSVTIDGKSSHSPAIPDKSTT